MRSFILRGSLIENYLLEYDLIDLSTFSYRSTNENLYLIAEIEYNNFILNVYPIIVLWVFIVLVVLLLAITEFLLKECTNWRSKFLTAIV